MQTLCELLQEKATEAIDRAFGDQLSQEEAIAEVVQCAQENFGHYQCNSALRLAKILKKSPRQVAEAIVEKMEQKAPSQAAMYSKVEIAGPGFINITLDPIFLSKELQNMLEDSHLGISKPKKQQRVIVEFSSPNIAKELHVGHLRSTIIGDCIARLFEFLGHDVVRLNHVGDWGTQFGMLISYLEEKVPGVLEGKKEAELSELMHWYKEAKKLFDADADFRKRSQLKVVELQAEEPNVISAWKMICGISEKAFQEIYDMMDIKLKQRGESFYNPFLPDVIAELESKGIVEVSDGAKCVFLEGFQNREGNPLPFIIQKSDGGYNYATTDLAAMRHRIKVEKANRIIVVVDIGQSLHFKMLYETARKGGFFEGLDASFDHVAFGLVLGPDGKKFKTRSGETEKLIDLLNGAVKRAKSIVEERLPDLPSHEVAQMANILGIDAVKYADLSSHRQKDYHFSYDRMLRFEGNTAIFLLYAYVRILSIQRKTNADMKTLLEQQRIILEHPTEIMLGLHLRRFGEVLNAMTKDLLPHRLCEYLYELAEKFHAFFRDCRVEGSKEEKQRLVLLELTSRILKQGLEILGLKTLERM